MDVPLCSNDRTKEHGSDADEKKTFDSFLTFHTLATAKFASLPLVDRYSVVTDEITPVRSSVTRNAYPGTCCSQSFDSDGWKRDTKIPWYDAIDRALRALSNDTKFALERFIGCWDMVASLHERHTENSKKQHTPTALPIIFGNVASTLAKTSKHHSMQNFTLYQIGF